MTTEISAERADEPTSTNTLAMIARAASDPRVSVEKMVELQRLHERIIDREAKAQYVAAFAAAAMEMPYISKTGAIKNNSGQVQSRYSKWEDIDSVVRPILRRNGLVLSFELSEAAGKALAVCAVLTHVGGHQERSGPMPLPVDSTGAKNAVQGTGSAMSYGKRYATIAMLNIVTQDDHDGGRPTATVEDGDAGNRVTYETAKMIAETDGINAYGAHFQNLPRTEKLWLTSTKAKDSDETLHNELKRLAAEADAKFEQKGGGR